MLEDIKTRPRPHNCCKEEFILHGSHIFGNVQVAQHRSDIFQREILVSGHVADQVVEIPLHLGQGSEGAGKLGIIQATRIEITARLWRKERKIYNEMKTRTIFW